MNKRQQELQLKLRKFIDSIQIDNRRSFENSMHELKEIDEKYQSRDQGSHQLYEKANQLLSLQKIRKYRNLKQKAKQNQQIIIVTEKGKSVALSMQMFTNLSSQNINENYQAFAKTIQAINQFEQIALTIQANISLPTLREQIYLQMLGKVQIAIQNSDLMAERFKKIILTNGLPLKKDEVRKEGITEDNRQFFLFCIYRQACLSTAKRYLLSLLEKEDRGNDQTLLYYYWQPLEKILSYLFIGITELRNLEEPSWLFEYMQQILNVNYKYFLEFVCLKDLKQQIYVSITRHFLNTTFNSLFVHIITRRFEQDLPNLNQFLIFNFIDQLGKFEQKLAASFSIRPPLVESLIARFDSSHQILSKTLEYEQKWFQTKIFEDFINIDYSRVNLKNLDAFNIVGSFLSLFERLHRKYANIQEPKIKQKVFKFYEKQLFNLIAHVKTSFDRIYHNSKLPKIDVLLSFKRVQNELRASLSQFLAENAELQQSIQKEYYEFLEQYFEVCALEAVNPIHKKLHISLGDIMNYLNSSEQNEHQKYLSSFGKIFDDWEGKMEQILKFSNYSDTKVRAIFFKYLQATNFSLVGLNLYLKIFQPYLRLLFTEDRHRALISMITMSRQAFNEYIESHSASLAFLTPEEIKQLKAFKRSAVIE